MEELRNGTLLVEQGYETLLERVQKKHEERKKAGAV